MSQSITISAVGDIMFGDSHYCIGSGVRSLFDKKKHASPFEHVLKIFRASDVVIGNLEAVLSDKGFRRESLPSAQYRGKREFARYLSDANVSIVSMANNHILDHGLEAFAETVQGLSEAGIQPVGVRLGAGGAERDAGVSLDIHGIRVGILSFCLNDERSTRPIVANTEDIIEAIELMKTRVDRVVISLHWGDEFLHVPSPRQVSIAHRFIDAGADILLGHHPHVLQGIESYKGKLIVYSLGNFVFDQNWSEDCRRSMILNILLDREGPIAFKAIPVRLNDSFQPVPLLDREHADSIARLEKLGKELLVDSKGRQRTEGEYGELVSAIQKDRYRKIHWVALRQLPRLPIRIALQLLLRPILRRFSPLPS